MRDEPPWPTDTRAITPRAGSVCLVRELALGPSEIGHPFCRDLCSLFRQSFRLSVQTVSLTTIGETSNRKEKLSPAVLSSRSPSASPKSFLPQRPDSILSS